MNGTGTLDCTSEVIRWDTWLIYLFRGEISQGLAIWTETAFPILFFTSRGVGTGQCTSVQLIRNTVPDYVWQLPDNPHPIDDINGDGRWICSPAGATRPSVFATEGNRWILPVDATLDFVAMNVVDRFHQAGDVNHDGYRDLLSVDYSPGPWGSYVTVHWGCSWPDPTPALVLDYAEAPFDFVPFQTGGGLGDVSGDGVDDFALSTVGSAWGQRGTVFLYGGQDLDANPPRPELPSDVRVSVYPNPFNADATFEITLPAYADEELDLKLVNVLGRWCGRKRGARRRPFGGYRFHRGIFLASGIYLLSVSSPKQTAITKFVVLK